MKIIRRGTTAALVAFCGLFAIAASATEILNIPASAAQPAVDDFGNNCAFTGTIGFTASTASGHCELDFPLMIPAGRTIKQIGILHDDNAQFPDPFIAASLVLRDIHSGNYNVKFSWSSSNPVPANTLESGLLMAQFGKNYPDAFLMQADSLYHVDVELNNGATNLGIWVVYE